LEGENGMLTESMKSGNLFSGPALADVGEAMKELSEVKDSLDMEVKQNFIDPLQNLHDKDLREIQHHLKKMEGRRLDFDYKKKRQGKLPDEELRQALEKFDESKEIAESSMFNLLEMDIEQVSQLSALVQAQLEYHKQATQILQRVTSKLEDRYCSFSKFIELVFMRCRGRKSMNRIEKLVFLDCDILQGNIISIPHVCEGLVLKASHLRILHEGNTLVADNSLLFSVISVDLVSGATGSAGIFFSEYVVCKPHPF
uniref:BAR domain-containing protein n=1 Tax=Meleagris gallopavo TaxID=9103 RepID=G1N9W6_MELGA